MKLLLRMQFFEQRKYIYDSENVAVNLKNRLQSGIMYFFENRLLASEAPQTSAQLALQPAPAGADRKRKFEKGARKSE